MQGAEEQNRKYLIFLKRAQPTILLDNVFFLCPMLFVVFGTILAKKPKQ